MDPDPEVEEEELVGEEDASVDDCAHYSNRDVFKFISVNRNDDVKASDTAVVRPITSVLNYIDNAHGSVRHSQGLTTVIVAVYGPSDIRMSKEQPHRAAVDVLFRPKVTGFNSTLINAGCMDPMVEERSLEQTICSVLESVICLEDHPQAGFNVIVHEIQDDGAFLSTCLNGVCLALLNAGCSLKSVFAAVTLFVYGKSVIVDPSKEQIKRTGVDGSLLTLVLTNAHEVLLLKSTGLIQKSAMEVAYKFIHGHGVDEIFKHVVYCVQ